MGMEGHPGLGRATPCDWVMWGRVCSFSGSEVLTSVFSVPSSNEHGDLWPVVPGWQGGDRCKLHRGYTTPPPCSHTASGPTPPTPLNYFPWLL